MIQGAIFDLDGTLFDSMFIWDTAGEVYLRSIGREPEENLQKVLKPMSLRQSAEYIREHTPIYQRMYKARKETIERVFADAKEKHGMRYTRYTGLAQVTNWVKLAFAAMNLKKFAKWRWKDTHSRSFSYLISIIFPQYAMNPCFA